MFSCLKKAPHLWFEPFRQKEYNVAIAMFGHTKIEQLDSLDYRMRTVDWQKDNINDLIHEKQQLAHIYL